MRNRIIPEAEIKAVESALKQVDTIVELHGTLEPNMSDSDNRLDIIHGFMYLDLLKEFISSAKMLEAMLKISEESLTDIITDGGKIPLEVVEMQVSMKVLSKIKECI